jgi:hypothetical protein
MSWLTIVAWIQTQWELSLILLNRARRRLLLPIALWGGRDMMLLTNGQWIDSTRTVPDVLVQAFYSAEHHTLSNKSGGRNVRWPWLSVRAGVIDMSDFFQGLRISSGLDVSRDKALMLYAHQKGVVPVGDLHIVNRDGEEEVIRADGPPSVEETRRQVESVNHIE